MADTKTIAEQLLEAFADAAEKAGINDKSGYYKDQRENLKNIAKNLNNLSNNDQDTREDAFDSLSTNIENFFDYDPDYGGFEYGSDSNKSKEHDQLDKSEFISIIASNIPSDLTDEQKAGLDDIITDLYDKHTTEEQKITSLDRTQNMLMELKQGDALNGLGKQHKKEFEGMLSTLESEYELQKNKSEVQFSDDARKDETVDESYSLESTYTAEQSKLLSETIQDRQECLNNNITKMQNFLTNIETKANKGTVSRIGDVLSAAAKVVKTLGSDEAKAELDQAMSMMHKENRENMKSAVTNIREQISKASPKSTNFPQKQKSQRDFSRGSGRG